MLTSLRRNRQSVSDVGRDVPRIRTRTRRFNRYDLVKRKEDQILDKGSRFLLSANTKTRAGPRQRTPGTSWT